MSNPHILVCYDDAGSPVSVSFHDDRDDAERAGNVSDLQFRVFAPVISKMDEPTNPSWASDVLYGRVQPTPTYYEEMRQIDQAEPDYDPGPEPYTHELNDALIIYRCLTRGVPIEHIATVLHEYDRELARCGAADPDSISTPKHWRSFIEMVAANPPMFGIDPDQLTDDDDPNSSPAQ